MTNTGLKCDDPFAKISGPHACQVKPNSKPWIISLYIIQKRNNMTRFTCGGTLIGSKVALTAAHCVCKCKIRRGYHCQQFEVSPNCNQWQQMYVIAGDHDKTKYDEGEQKNIISRGKVHVKWDGTKSI